MFFRSIASAFFLESSSTDDLPTLTERIGMTKLWTLGEDDRKALGFHEPDRVIMGGLWGAFGDTWAIVDELDQLQLRCFQLYSSSNQYLDAIRDDRPPHGVLEAEQLKYIRTFRDACLSLEPRVAFLDTRSHYEHEPWLNKQGTRDLVLAMAPLVAAFDTDALARQRFSLLYLDAAMADRWEPDPVDTDRDMVVMPTGRLLFASSGPTRMA